MSIMDNEGHDPNGFGNTPSSADQQEIMRINNELRETLLAVKALCAGDKAPNWKDDWATTATRGRIMDLVDGVVR